MLADLDDHLRMIEHDALKDTKKDLQEEWQGCQHGRTERKPMDDGLTERDGSRAGKISRDARTKDR